MKGLDAAFASPRSHRPNVSISIRRRRVAGSVALPSLPRSARTGPRTWSTAPRSASSEFARGPKGRERKTPKSQTTPRGTVSTHATRPKPQFYDDRERSIILDRICERISLGEPLAVICRDPDMPGLRTVYDWLEKSGEDAARFARAREAGYDMIAADCLQIADDGGNNPNHAKLRVETRLKLLSKWDPKRWGDAFQVKHAGHEGQNLRDVSEGEAVAKIAAILEAARRRGAIPALEYEAETDPNSHPGQKA
jgi:hypothetical protein